MSDNHSKITIVEDNPEMDATDFAHPAWWRGHDHTVAAMCQKINDVLDGKDDGAGVAQEPWESTRRRLLAMGTNCNPRCACGTLFECVTLNVNGQEKRMHNYCSKCDAP